MARTNIMGLSFISFVFAVVYVVGHLGEVADIMMLYVQYNERSYLNIENFAYCLLGIARLVFPVAILYPHRDLKSRTKMLKIICYFTGAMYFAANLWLITWFFTCLFSGEWFFDVAQFQREYSMMFNHLEWSSRNPETIFYNHLVAIFWINIGYNINRDRKKTCKFVVASLLFRYIAPVLFYYIYRDQSIPEWWIKKTLPIMCSDVAITMAFLYASQTRAIWKNYICRLKYHVKKKKASDEDIAAEVISA